MSAAMKACGNCGNEFQGRANASYCSAACRQRARRARTPRIRDNCDTQAVTVTAHGRRTAESRAVLDALDAELAANAEQLGQPLEWSAAERAVLDLIGDTIDRRTDLQARYEVCDDGSTRLKLAAELRLMEAALARLLKQVRTELPAPPTLRSRKASHAAHVRWDRASDQ